MAGIADGVEGVVQSGHPLSGLTINRILLVDGLGIETEENAEEFNIFAEVGQFESDNFTTLHQVVDMKVLEVAHHNGAGIS